ncbi:MAG: hypothetical protein JJE29_07130 [Peptostreptococcaceae bacterium]|nr:hypothetical protein [Peptostreptococcaceae bacterium]
MAYVGFDIVPHVAEEYDFPPKTAFGLISLAVSDGEILYILVAIAIAAAFPWEVFLYDNLNWVTGSVMSELLWSMGVVFLVIGVTMGMVTGMKRKI